MVAQDCESLDLAVTCNEVQLARRERADHVETGHRSHRIEADELELDAR
jgi:hypothetical protein